MSEKKQDWLLNRVGKTAWRKLTLPVAYNPRYGWTCSNDCFEVQIMAVVGIHVMARCRGCIPFAEHRSQFYPDKESAEASIKP